MTTINNELNKLSTQVSKHLKLVDEKVLKTNYGQFDWNLIKRTPQFLKSKIKFPGSGHATVDEEFDSMENTVRHQDEALRSVLSYLKQFLWSLNELVNDSVHVSEQFHNLIDPYSNFKHDAAKIDAAYDLWASMVQYKHLIMSVDMKMEIDALNKGTVVKLEAVSSGMLKSVFKRIRDRQFSLLDYDNYRSEHEALLARQQSGKEQLTLKQSNYVYTLERKVAECKAKYEIQNALLKKELPVFIRLVQTVIDYAAVDIYLIHLLYCYKITTELQKGKIKVASSSSRSSDALIQESESRYADILPKIRELKLFSPKTSGGEQNLTCESCIALYDFDGEQDDDLSFKKNDRIKILETDGNWWKGALHDKTGNFPSNYVTLSA
ncbi:uncharacterized protein LODBEIA_P04480 [Lodderomyces beijingensis]|uniref:SH3 domain-containing protein n=1 Tax=Lodderomyces beijingensis TaxID=1775926 RepID=A0ABP0ZDF2_9ASCO